MGKPEEKREGEERDLLDVQVLGVQQYMGRLALGPLYIVFGTSSLNSLRSVTSNSLMYPTLPFLMSSDWNKTFSSLGLARGTLGIP